MKNKINKLFILIALSTVVICTAFVIGIFAFTNAQSSVPELTIVGKNLSFSESVYLKYAVSVENVDEPEEAKLLIWTQPENAYVIDTEDFRLDSTGTSTINNTKCLIFDFKRAVRSSNDRFCLCKSLY